MDHPTPALPMMPEPHVRDFYVDSLRALEQAAVPYVLGGGYAMAYYTGIVRHTKDLDVFVKPQDAERALESLAARGYRTERTWPPFLVKALSGDAFVDILYNSGNGLCPVDDDWFTYAIDAEVIGCSTRMCPVEEMIWSKAYVQDRDRYDGADIAHLILARGRAIDWPRLLRRFDDHEPVLLAHLMLYRYSYPSERDRIPGWVMEHLISAEEHAPASAERICRGTFLAQRSYQHDVQKWGFLDARLKPRGPLTPADLSQLPAA